MKLKLLMLLFHNPFSLLFFFFSIHFPHPSAAFSYLKLPLLHHKRSFPFHDPSNLLFSDSRRHHRLFHSKNSTTAAQLPITSGANAGTGQYFVSLSLGTPPQPLLLVADTGSDLIWVTCSACRNCSSRPPRSAFLARHSATFAPFHCFDSSCQLVPNPKNVICNRTRLHSTCRYEYSYADGSLSEGFFAAETASFNTSRGRRVRFKNLRFGCGLKASGPSVTGPSFTGAQGVLGLGLDRISLPSQLRRKNFANKFSYCLKDYTRFPAPTSYLTIGAAGRGVSNSSEMSYTPLINNLVFPTFYYIGIEYVSVGGRKLPINSSVWAIDDLGNGGTLLDSGTTLTFLIKGAYDKLLGEFRRRVKLPKPSKPDPILEFCVNVSGIAKPKLPQLSFGLVGGSVFSPPPQNYFIDTAPEVKCLSLQPVTSPGGSSVIGNLMQQGFLFEYDKDRSRLGFTRQGCAVP